MATKTPDEIMSERLRTSAEAMTRTQEAILDHSRLCIAYDWEGAEVAAIKSLALMAAYLDAVKTAYRTLESLRRGP